jgi:hypothetical protein
MRKIANTHELTAELARISAYAGTPNPSRQVLAADLRVLASRLEERTIEAALPGQDPLKNADMLKRLLGSMKVMQMSIEHVEGQAKHILAEMAKAIPLIADPVFKGEAEKLFTKGAHAPLLMFANHSASPLYKLLSDAATLGFKAKDDPGIGALRQLHSKLLDGTSHLGKAVGSVGAEAMDVLGHIYNWPDTHPEAKAHMAPLFAAINKISSLSPYKAPKGSGLLAPAPVIHGAMHAVETLIGMFEQAAKAV